SIGLGDELGYYEILHRQGKLPLRIVGYYDDMPNIPVTSGFGNFWVRYGGCKLYLDGSLGGGTAALTEPYADRPGTGTLLYSDAQLTELLREMGERYLQPQIHAIGDAAIDQLIRCVRKVKQEGVAWPYPVKASHLQVCRPDQVQQLGELEIAGDVQPHQLVSDVHMAPARLGEKRKDWCFPFRSMINAGVLLVGSSDCPVEPIDPLLSIRGALVRQNPEGYPREGWNPAEKISLEEALAMYTRNPARLTGRDDKKGSLRQGYRADITVLDKDLSSLEPDELPGVKTRAVLVNGTVRYSV
ncbi:MAG TPA: amidohydrolase family protein, partial [Synergistaceae bacterium]|nr:amidohydrolase family protein [Synergistaceae bacterium]